MVLQVVGDVNDFLTNTEKLSQQLVVGRWGGCGNITHHDPDESMLLQADDI